MKKPQLLKIILQINQFIIDRFGVEQLGGRYFQTHFFLVNDKSKNQIKRESSFSAMNKQENIKQTGKKRISWELKFIKKEKFFPNITWKGNKYNLHL